MFTVSAIDSQEEGKRARLTLRRRTKNPRRVHRSWYIPDRGNLPIPSEKDIDGGCHASRKCSELVLHGYFAVITFFVEQGEGGGGSYKLASGVRPRNWGLRLGLSE